MFRRNKTKKSVKNTTSEEPLIPSDILGDISNQDLLGQVNQLCSIPSPEISSEKFETTNFFKSLPTQISTDGLSPEEIQLLGLSEGPQTQTAPQSMSNNVQLSTTQLNQPRKVSKAQNLEKSSSKPQFTPQSRKLRMAALQARNAGDMELAKKLLLQAKDLEKPSSLNLKSKLQTHSSKSIESVDVSSNKSHQPVSNLSTKTVFTDESRKLRLKALQAKKSGDISKAKQYILEAKLLENQVNQPNNSHSSLSANPVSQQQPLESEAEIRAQILKLQKASIQAKNAGDMEAATRFFLQLKRIEKQHKIKENPIDISSIGNAPPEDFDEESVNEEEEKMLASLMSSPSSKSQESQDSLSLPETNSVKPDQSIFDEITQLRLAALKAKQDGDIETAKKLFLKSKNLELSQQTSHLSINPSIPDFSSVGNTPPEDIDETTPNDEEEKILAKLAETKTQTAEPKPVLDQNEQLRQLRLGALKAKKAGDIETAKKLFVQSKKLQLMIESNQQPILPDLSSVGNSPPDDIDETTPNDEEEKILAKLAESKTQTAEPEPVLDQNEQLRQLRLGALKAKKAGDIETAKKLFVQSKKLQLMIESNQQPILPDLSSVGNSPPDDIDETTPNDEEEKILAKLAESKTQTAEPEPVLDQNEQLRQLRLGALKAKKAGDIETAKKLFRQSKELEKLLQQTEISGKSDDSTEPSTSSLQLVQTSQSPSIKGKMTPQSKTLRIKALKAKKAGDTSLAKSLILQALDIEKQSQSNSQINQSSVTSASDYSSQYDSLEEKFTEQLNICKKHLASSMNEQYVKFWNVLVNENLNNLKRIETLKNHHQPPPHISQIQKTVPVELVNTDIPAGVLSVKLSKLSFSPPIEIADNNFKIDLVFKRTSSDVFETTLYPDDTGEFSSPCLIDLPLTQKVFVKYIVRKKIVFNLYVKESSFFRTHWIEYGRGTVPLSFLTKVATHSHSCIIKSSKTRSTIVLPILFKLRNPLVETQAEMISLPFYVFDNSLNSSKTTMTTVSSKQKSKPQKSVKNKTPWYSLEDAKVENILSLSALDYEKQLCQTFLDKSPQDFGLRARLLSLQGGEQQLYNLVDSGQLTPALYKKHLSGLFQLQLGYAKQYKESGNLEFARYCTHRCLRIKNEIKNIDA